MADTKSSSTTPPPRPVVICGPSGVGKGTLIELLQKSFPSDKFGFSVSHTTRKPREGEENGVHYNFSTVDAMKDEIEAGKFVEYAEVHGNYYGTSIKSVESVQNQNLICLLDIDIQGAQNVKKSTLDAHYLFIAPPSMVELEKRLRGRGTEAEDAIQRRLANAQGEMDYGMVEGNFDAVLVNNNLEKTLEEMVEKFKEWYPHLLDVEEPPRPVVICGPSGVGKGTLIELLQKSFPSNKFGFSVSHTTRKPREGEENGVHYNFSTVDAMKDEIEAGKFVEYAEVHGNYYGTSIKSVESVQNQNLICLLDIDIQGAQNVKKSTLDAYYLFIAPPSMVELEKRLRGRGTEAEDAIQRRLANAQGEMDYGTAEGNFDAVLVNNNLDKTLEEMVEKFKDWYPHLLDTEEKKEEPQASLNNNAVGEDIPPPIVDPLSFPKTDEGLTALLSEIDKECPLESYVQSDLNYHASNVHVGAGKKLDIPLPPVEQDGSKIEWNVTLVDKFNEGLDIDFGLVVIVDGEEVMAREMGRILSPSLDGKGSGDDSSSVGEEKTSAKGKFTVANSAPVTVVIKLDNSHAWIKPKVINYSFNITSPVDNNMIERSKRAKSVLPKILEGQKSLLSAKEKEASRAEALGRIQQEMEEKINGLNKQIDDDKAIIESLQKRADEAEEEAKVRAAEIKESLEMVKKEEESIESCTSAIIALEEECAKLKMKWEELKVERQVREEEKITMEARAEESKDARVKLQEEISAKKSEEQSKMKDIEGVEKERSLLKDNLNDLEKEKAARKAEEEKYSSDLNFLKAQLEAVKLRFIDG